MDVGWKRNAKVSDICWGCQVGCWHTCNTFGLRRKLGWKQAWVRTRSPLRLWGEEACD